MGLTLRRKPAATACGGHQQAAHRTGILDTFAEVFQKGWLSIKLYFMIGMPTETKEDVEAIGQLVDKSATKRENIPARPRNQGQRIDLVPKAHTPFQWFAQNTEKS